MKLTSMNIISAAASTGTIGAVKYWIMYLHLGGNIMITNMFTANYELNAVKIFLHNSKKLNKHKICLV